MKFSCRYSAKMQSICLYLWAELTMLPVHFIFSTSIYDCSHFATRSQIGNIATRWACLSQECACPAETSWLCQVPQQSMDHHDWVGRANEDSYCNQFHCNFTQSIEAGGLHEIRIGEANWYEHHRCPLWTWTLRPINWLWNPARLQFASSEHRTRTWRRSCSPLYS